MNTENYIELNRESWNKRVDYHLQSAFYDMQSFMSGVSSLNGIELDLLGDIAGRSILHLQCHFGQDTLSLARMGAKVTGADLSDKAINEARRINGELGLDAEFVCCNIYDLPQHLDKEFDIVFTSYGTIGWLPDLDAWARIIARFLKPGGKFVFAEFHPLIWIFDEDFTKIQYSYFNTGPIVESCTGTYADRDAPIELREAGWNHSLSEVFSALIGSGLNIEQFAEYDYSPYPCFRHVEEIGERKYRIPQLGDKAPLVYSIVAGKRG